MSLPNEIKQWSQQSRRESLETLFRFARLDGHPVELSCFGAGTYTEGFTRLRGMCVAYTSGGLDGAERIILDGGDGETGVEPATPLYGQGYYVVPARLSAGIEARYVPDAWHVATNSVAGEGDVVSCNVIAIDVDPVRPKGINSDKAEYLGSLELGWTIWELMIKLGVLETALAYGSSGNGCHVLVALDAPWSAEIKALRQEFLAILGVLYDTEKFKIDPAMADGSRYIPAYGTAKRKGPTVGERKQRRSWLKGPDVVEPLSLDAFGNLVATLKSTLTPEQLEALEKRREKRPGARTAAATTEKEGGDRPLDRCNAVSVSEVARALGIDPENPKCPECGAEKGIDCLEAKGQNIIKCQHQTCGFKVWTPVELVRHALGIDTLKSNKDGTKQVLAWFVSQGFTTGRRDRKAEAIELLRSEDVTLDDDASAGCILDALVARVPASARGEALTEALKPMAGVLLESDDLELDRVATSLNSKCGRGVPKKALVDTLRKLRTAAKKEDREDDETSSGGKSGGFERGDAPELAERYIGEFGDENLVFDTGALYLYAPETGLWTQVTAAEISSYIGRTYAGKPAGPKGLPLKLSRTSIDGARKQIQDETARPEYFRQGRPGFAFRNGFVSISPSGEISLDPHDRENRAIYRYDFDWSEDVDASKLIGFYGELFRGDPEAGIKTQFLLEFYGASLIGEVWRAGKALIKVGGGNDGKSVESQIMQAVFPAGSVQGVTPHDWSNDQKLAKLATARLNYAGEISSKEIKDPEIVKAVITGRDLVMAKVIYREPFSFYVRAGHVMSSNLPLPGVSDTSKGFWRRWELVEFTRSFLPEEENSMIVEAVTSDRQAIACMLIQAAAQFVGNGCRFTQIPPSSEALKVEWQSGAEPVRRWVSDCCEFTFDLVNEGVLWDAFKVWAEGNRHLAMSSATFRGRLCSIMRDLARGRWAQDLGPLRGELAKGGFIRGPNGERQYPLTSPSIAGHAASAATESVGISVERV